MNRVKSFIATGCLVTLLSLTGVSASAQSADEQANTQADLAARLDLSQVLQQVVNHYPSLQSAAVQVARAQQENIKAQSQLSWQLNSSVGFNRNTNLLGSATDRLNLDGGLHRDLSSGGVLGFNASVSREDAEQSFSPNIPNPATKTRVDVNYRHRLARGADNPGYQLSIAAAEAAENIALSDKRKTYDQIAAQVIELYLAAASTRARIGNLDQTIERNLRLQAYINDEFKLGLSEQKDVLQVQARLSTNRADKQSLQVLWQQQLISLNRLMGRSWEQHFAPQLSVSTYINNGFEGIYQQAQAYNADLMAIEAQLKQLKSEIKNRRDQQKDQLDLVMFVGNEINQGDTASGDFDESEVIGGISLEFNRGLDKRGFDAQLRQAFYDRDIALQNKKQVLQDLQYNIASLLAEIEAAEKALAAFKTSIKAEKKKLDEALVRYRDGRIETDRIIEFESQLAAAELSYDLQAIELKRRYHTLDLLRGEIWKDIHIVGRVPHYSTDNGID